MPFILPESIRRNSLERVPVAFVTMTPESVNFFHDPEALMIGVFPLGAQVACTDGFSETPDSS
jgi:hypothetical protein